MFTKVTKILGVIALTGWMGAANAALIVDFSWDSKNGKIIGEIYGLSDNGENLEASGLILTSVGGMQVNIDVFDDEVWRIEENKFNVRNGLLVKDTLFSAGGANVFYPLFLIEVRHKRYSGGYYITGGAQWHEFESQYGVSIANRVLVPEPSSVILMLLGLAGLSFARYRKQY
jgi:hypothetical protein